MEVPLSWWCSALSPSEFKPKLDQVDVMDCLQESGHEERWRLGCMQNPVMNNNYIHVHTCIRLHVMCSRSSLPLVTRLTFQIYFHSRNCQYQQPIFSSQNQMSRNHKRNLDRMRQSKVFRAKHYIDNNSYFLPIPLLLTRNQYKAKKSIKNNTSKKQARGSQPILSLPNKTPGEKCPFPSNFHSSPFQS